MFEFKLTYYKNCKLHNWNQANLKLFYKIINKLSIFVKLIIIFKAYFKYLFNLNEDQFICSAFYWLRDFVTILFIYSSLVLWNKSSKSLTISWEFALKIEFVQVNQSDLIILKILFNFEIMKMNIQVHTWIYGTFEGWSKKTEMSMKVNGRTTRLTVQEDILTPTELHTKENGKKTNNIGTISVQTNIHFHYFKIE